MDDQVETANLCKAELLLSHTGLVDLLPDLDVVGLAGALDSSLVVLEMNESGGELGPVGDGGEEDLGSLVVALLVGLVTRLLDVGDVGRAEEVLQLGELVGASEAEGKSGVDRGLAESLAGHAEVLDEVFILAGVRRSLDDLEVVRRVLGLDV